MPFTFVWKILLLLRLKIWRSSKLFKILIYYNIRIYWRLRFGLLHDARPDNVLSLQSLRTFSIWKRKSPSSRESGISVSVLLFCLKYVE